MDFPADSRHGSRLVFLFIVETTNQTPAFCCALLHFSTVESVDGIPGELRVWDGNVQVQELFIQITALFLPKQLLWHTTC